MPPIPVIDLFAGPGGLSEGFSRHGVQDWSKLLSDVRNDAPVPKFRQTRFKVSVSVEMDKFAHETLELRALVRKLREDGRDRLFEDFLNLDLTRPELFDKAGAAGRLAKEEAWCARLGDKKLEAQLDARILRSVPDDGPWVLIGGPPCQAYSLAGRSRNRGKADYRAEDDARHFLYREYLRIVARHRPPVFVMENVKGLLSSKVGGESMFERIAEDLRRPGRAVGGRNKNLGYSLYPVVASEGPAQLLLGATVAPSDYIVRMETLGIPQARHRIILLGIRDDVARKPTVLLPSRAPVTVEDVIEGLPPLRSGLSRTSDSEAAWKNAVSAAANAPWLRDINPRVRKQINDALSGLEVRPEGRGAEVIPGGKRVLYANEWYQPDGFNLVLNHSTRQHIEGDLHRYLFASAWGVEYADSPKLREFPEGLLPAHHNARKAVSEGGLFGDRFRVQVASKPSTTVTSHISKDGHYYIHHDPSQCRSLTVREAARLQTFPDDYFFCGTRTKQYHQVGNAVPPLLATQIASIVADLFS